ncbi:MAG: TlpA disulfide reductase family protein, partial [Planctomycetota bacterium]|nr:TlpA disulfide reductase family protein [Planctomycetota bacterium]
AKPDGAAPASSPAKTAANAPIPVDTPTADKPAVEKPVDASKGAAQVDEVRRVLSAMVEAYRKASTYQDVAQVRIEGRINGKPFSDRGNYVTTFERPNRIRLHAYQGTAVCDGTNLYAWVAGIPNQVLKLPAPSKIDIPSIFAGNVLADAMANGPTQNFAWIPLQMILLSSPNPLGTLLFEAKETRLLEPAQIEGHNCQRIQVRRGDGTCVFWIDEKTNILRRFEFPTDHMAAMAGANKLEGLSLVADFTEARFDQKIDLKAFQTAFPPDVEMVDALTPTVVQMLGKSSDFIFVGMDSKPLTLKSLAGKTAVIAFWSSASPPCRETLVEIEKVYQKYKKDPKVAFLAVSIDPPSVTNEQLQKAIAEMRVALPIYRISQPDADKAFKVRVIPTTVVLDAKGKIQDYQAGRRPGAAAVLNQGIQLISGGKDIATETRRNFETLKIRYAEIFQAMVNDDLYVDPAIIVRRMSVAKSSPPKKAKLDRLWVCTKLQSPGGMLIVEQSGPQGSQIFVAHAGGRAVARLDAAGNIVADHKLDIPPQELVTRLRTFKGKDGKRYFLGMSPGMQQLHIFDENWKTLLSFPQDAYKNPHAGLGDAVLADSDGDGVGEISAGYLGLVGVKSIDLAGKIRWSNRALANVFSLAVGGADKSGRRPLYCVNDRAALVALGPRGKVQQKISLDGRLLFGIAAANLDDKPQPELCGLSSPSLGENLAVGLDTQGNLKWKYQMPKGTFTQTTERIHAAHLSKTGPGQWILLGPDGSVHIVDIDGKPVDQFNYGAVINSMATSKIGGRTALLFASRKGIEAVAVALP